MEFAVSRTGTALVTLHGGSDTTACDEAADELASNLESLTTEGTISDWAIDDSEVYEHPTAPFDPYTVTIEFSVTVIVDADESDAAAELGASAIDDALENADLRSITYTSAPAASAA